MARADTLRGEDAPEVVIAEPTAEQPIEPLGTSHLDGAGIRDAFIDENLQRALASAEETVAAEAREGGETIASAEFFVPTLPNEAEASEAVVEVAVGPEDNAEEEMAALTEELPAPEIFDGLDRDSGRQLQREFLTDRMKAALERLEKSRYLSADEVAAGDSVRMGLTPISMATGQQMTADFFDTAIAEAMGRLGGDHQAAGDIPRQP